MAPSVVITFRNIVRSATLKEAILARALELGTFYNRLISCDVVVELPQLGQLGGNRCRVRVALGIPGHRIIVNHDASLHPALKDAGDPGHSKSQETGAAHRDAKRAIHDAFDTARRRLQDAARRQRGDVKAHRAAALVPRRRLAQ